MSYPQAPWTLKGYAIKTLQLLDIDRVRPFIPSELNIISVWPGKTLGGVYLSYYGSDSVLEYSELIVVAGLISYSGKFGGWVSHIYVDNSDSIAGGREIWGLPKEMAEFNWEQDKRVTVRQGDRLLCSLNYNKPSFALPQKLFPAELEARLSLINSKLEIPSESPFAQLNIGQPLISAYADQMSLVAGAPSVVGQRVVEFSYR